MVEKETSIVTEEHLREIQLIEEFTGKPIDEVLNEYTLPELLRISAYLDWMKFF